MSPVPEEPPPGDLLPLALDHCKAGRIKEAGELFQIILTKDPGNSEALCNLGALICESGDPARAETYFRKTLEHVPGHEMALNNLGHSLLLQGRAEEASVAFTEATQLHPHSETGYHNMASAAFALENWQDAKSALEVTLRLSPGNPEALGGLGLVYMEEGEPEKARQYFREAIQSDPGNAGSWYGLGNACMDQGAMQDAKAAYLNVLEIDPAHKDAATNLAQTKLELDEFEGLLPLLEGLVEKYPTEWRNWISLGQVFYSMRNLPAAQDAFGKAMELAPDQWECWNSMGVAHQETGDLEKAGSCLEKATSLSPDAADAHWNLSLALLAKGDFERGWEEHRWRWKRRTFTSKMPKTQTPLWDGGEGSLCLHTEQGFGDNIQFLRYAKLAKETCKGELVVYTEAPLQRLFSTVGGIDAVLTKTVGWESQLANYDYHLPIMDLPLALGPASKAPIIHSPYIPTPGNEVEQWESELENHMPPGFRAGIVWEANPKNKKGLKRSIPENIIHPWIESFGSSCNFLCLQPERSGQPQRERNLFTLPRPPADFASTTDLFACLDIVISVDTAVAHLAGANGKETYLLLHAAPFWRWINGDMPDLWYPGMNIYKQPTIDDWEPPLAMLRKDLLAKITTDNTRK